MPYLEFGLSNKNYPELVDKFDGRLLVIGGARCVWGDLASIGVRPSADNGGFDVLCVNDIIMHYPGKIDHAYSNDHRWLPKWIDARRELHTMKFGGIRYVHSNNTGARYNWPWPGHGTSSLGAVYCGLAMGYEQIILCGVPLDSGSHYFDPPWGVTNFEREVSTQPNGDMQYWSNAKRIHFKGKVYGTSGRTADLLGRPDSPHPRTATGFD